MLLLTYDVSPTVLAVAGLVGLISFKWISYRTSNYYKWISKLPGPKPLPIIGNSHDIKGGYAGFLETMQLVWPRTFGEIYCWFVGSQVNVTISSPELMEPILKSQKILDKGVDYDWYHAWLEDGLLVTKGDKWRVRRRLLTPAFHFKILDDFVDVFNKQSRVMCDLLAKRCTEGANGTLIDIYPMLTNCALDVIGETATGTQLNAQIDGESKYAQAVHRMLKIITARTTKPWLANPYTFPLTPTGREHDRLLVTLHGFIDDVISKRREERKTSATINNNKWKPLIDLLLDMSDAGQGLSDRDIREEIGTFMFGGHDTTSASMCWFVYLMAAHPEHQEQIYEEIQDVFGDSDREITVEDLANLKHFDYCMKETLRMYPSAPLIERMANEDIQIGDYNIPAGSNILMLIYGMHHNPRIFPEPEKFDPERFYPENCIGRHPFAYIPFSAGPRNCIGQRFALTEEKVVLANLMRRFKFSVSPDMPKPIPSYQVVLKPLNGQPVIVTPRC